MGNWKVASGRSKNFFRVVCGGCRYETTTDGAAQLIVQKHFPQMMRENYTGTAPFVAARFCETVKIFDRAPSWKQRVGQLYGMKPPALDFVRKLNGGKIPCPKCGAVGQWKGNADTEMRTDIPR
ncbi:unnamed protein product [Vitrella brassicaformis CCMP3155]|uniref:Uncharacterized protein n=1 Tax=Vitrella brassicaformis (strain CCMP3155) TaxID=1169540 RepID=A0A0G4EL15_VITBC|nr:unnamed protein product [Vitrella brassicaformis CCMP3155]|eukprot:CEL98096.1 unnamed protein product [Vitrella brassicaformis CCMP3155]